VKAPKILVSAAVLALMAAPIALSRAGAPALADGGGFADGTYVQHNLVSDIPGLAAHTDPSLQNPWGQTTGPGLPIWVSDNAAGVATVYDGAGNPQPDSVRPRVVTIPAAPSAGSGATGTPTGSVFNPTADGFVVSENGVSGASTFVFATEDGTIAGWNPAVDPTHAITAVDRSTVTDPAGDVGAVYKGLTMVTTPAGKFLYAANFRFGVVDVFDSHFNLVESFTDSTVPAGFAPFGIHNIGGNLFVTFAKQDAAKHDDVAGQGNGFVDEFSPNGTLIMRLASGGALDSPWAVTLAPSTFGRFGGDILVGNFGNGHINAYDPETGHHLGSLRTADGEPLVIPDLWGLRFPAGSLNVVPGALYFAAGINNEKDGLFGDIVPSS
jgi:uncharacterized protein (TIGR03118 family)